jgi:hypothetical protein
VIRSLSFALLLSTAAVAQTVTHWSMATGETVSPDHDAMDVAAGWPGLRFDFKHGVSDRSDVGFALEVLYGIENTTDTKFGLGAAMPLRLIAYRKDTLLLGVHIDPGLRVYTDSNTNDLFLRFPAGGILGLQVTPQIRIAAGFDLNMALQTAHTAFFEIAPVVGFALEYLVDPGLQLGLNTRFGPSFSTLDNSGSRFAFTTEIVIGKRL